jgi:hypothetical protein
VLAEVLQPARHISEHSEEHTHRRRLDVPPGLPPREGVLPEPEQPSQLGLGEPEPLSERADLFGARVWFPRRRIG